MCNCGSLLSKDGCSQYVFCTHFVLKHFCPEDFIRWNIYVALHSMPCCVQKYLYIFVRKNSFRTDFADKSVIETKQQHIVQSIVEYLCE